MKVYVYGSVITYVNSDEQYLGTSCYTSYQSAFKALMRELEEDSLEHEFSVSDDVRFHEDATMKLWSWYDGDHYIKYWIKECDVEE